VSQHSSWLRHFFEENTTPCTLEDIAAITVAGTEMEEWIVRLDVEI
jgi:hypothetical protein